MIDFGCPFFPADALCYSLRSLPIPLLWLSMLSKYLAPPIDFLDFPDTAKKKKLCCTNPNSRSLHAPSCFECPSHSGGPADVQRVDGDLLFEIQNPKCS